MIKTDNCIINNNNGVEYITFPLLSKYENLVHAFSTKNGGVSKGKYATMNLSYNNGDNLDDVNENFRRFADAVGFDKSQIVFSKQTHTSNVEIINEVRELPDDVDGLITDKKGIVLCTTFADCVPILFYDHKREVIAACHSGWKGTVKEISRVVINKMTDVFGCDVSDISAVVGPAICQQCYEVDSLVVNELKKLSYLDLNNVLISTSEGHYLLDLKSVCKATLIDSGLVQSNIMISDICTCCNSEDLFSHRATKGNRGNLSMFISLK